MDTMTLTKEQMELKAMVPTVQSGNARVRELTPAQRRAVMFAQQQVLRARAAKKAKDERQAALTRIWRRKTRNAFPHDPCRQPRKPPTNPERYASRGHRPCTARSAHP